MSLPTFVANQLRRASRDVVMFHVVFGPILPVGVSGNFRTLQSMISAEILYSCGPSGGCMPKRYAHRPKFTALTEHGREVAAALLESEITRLLKRGCGDPTAMPIAIAPVAWTAIEERLGDGPLVPKVLRPA